MIGKDAPPRNNSGTGSTRVAELEAELAAVTSQRMQDQARLIHIARERDRLKFELTELAAADAGMARLAAFRKSRGSIEEGYGPIDGWILKAGIERARLRKEPSIPGSILRRITASLVLRFARAAARNQHYATAEVLYQTITLMAPRGFVWRQTGNMLAAQGLYTAAVDCFDRALEFDEDDSEAWHAKAMALRRSDRGDEGMIAMERGLALNPELAQRRAG